VLSAQNILPERASTGKTGRAGPDEGLSAPHGIAALRTRYAAARSVVFPTNGYRFESCT